MSKSNTVETKWVKNVNDLNNYDAVIIGSSIQYDRWMPEATEFVTANQNILSKLPVAYFFTCLALSIQNEKAAKKKAMAYSDKLYALIPQVKPVGVGRFAGVLDYNKLSFFILLILGSHAPAPTAAPPRPIPWRRTRPPCRSNRCRCAH